MAARTKPLVITTILFTGACFQPGTPPDIVTEGATGSSSTDATAEPRPDGSGSTAAASSAGSGSAGSSGGMPDADGSTGSSTTAAADSEDGTSTESVACDPLGPAGLPGKNPPAVWLANTSQGTISKIDSSSMTEVGRYLTRADAMGSPSHTAVSLGGDVVVANRNGGLTKIHGDASECPDANRDGLVSTSSRGEFLPWPEEECRAWHMSSGYTSQYPVAWTAGELDPETCERVNEKVWTSGVLGGTTIEVALVDGETGVVEQSVQIPEIAPDAGGQGGPVGFRAGAVDAEGSFWVATADGGYLARVEPETLEYDSWELSFGGQSVTVGASGYVFACSPAGVSRFDVGLQTLISSSDVGGSGCVEDEQGRLWLAGAPMVAIDVETFAQVAQVGMLEGTSSVAWGFDGMLWAVGTTAAYRIDTSVEPPSFNWVGGLVGAEVNGDPTGFGLASAMGG